jgi:hypothetical protein
VHPSIQSLKTSRPSLADRRTSEPEGHIVIAENAEQIFGGVAVLPRRTIASTMARRTAQWINEIFCPPGTRAVRPSPTKREPDRNRRELAGSA